jgi:plasmid stabilization system protein ParE
MAKRIVWTNQAKADVRGIEQSIALQILKTLARYAQTGEGNTKQLRDIEPPLIRLRAQDHRVFFRDKGDSCKSPACWIVRRLTANGFRGHPDRGGV